MESVNANGGAIALGHQLGATGCILATKAIDEPHSSATRLTMSNQVPT
jgi:acetyl-CoA acetyltransferase